MSLADARERLEEARRQLATKIDLGEQRKAVKAAGGAATANSFEVVAREWFAKQQKEWSIQYAHKIIRHLENDIFPWIGSRPVETVTVPELLKHLERIEQRGAIETNRRALQTCGAVFRYAVRTWQSEAIQRKPGVHGIYNQAQYLEERRGMMQGWADYLSTLKTSAASKIASFERRDTQPQALGVST
ncbi:site-specific integrase [Luteibacter yeojuensis]